MAFSESATVVSHPSGSTFAATDLYKFVVWNSTAEGVTLPNTTGNILPLGVLYGVTSTTNAGQAVPVAIDGIVKVNMAASTLAAGNSIGSSTAGLGIAPTTDAYTFGTIVSGSSGTVGRINSVQVVRGPLGAP